MASQTCPVLTERTAKLFPTLASRRLVQVLESKILESIISWFALSIVHMLHVYTMYMCMYILYCTCNVHVCSYHTVIWLVMSTSRICGQCSNSQCTCNMWHATCSSCVYYVVVFEPWHVHYFKFWLKGLPLPFTQYGSNRGVDPTRSPLTKSTSAKSTSHEVNSQWVNFRRINC